MENINIKPTPKPTLSNPTSQGKKLDTYFKKQIKSTGMSIKEENEETGKKTSLKKKIFKLDKMETLVHTDENLSKVFNDLKQDADMLYGYHWNETILNMIFNDYVLNSPKYLQKYKNTRAKTKTRRGEEGIAQLQNDIDKENDVKSGVEARKNDLLAKDAEAKENVDEIFGLGAKNWDNELPLEQRSKNDQYFVDGRNNIVAIAPYKNPEQFQSIIQQNTSKAGIKKLPWAEAFRLGVKGVPAQLPDGSSAQKERDDAKDYLAQKSSYYQPELAEEKVDEIFGLGAKNWDTELPLEQRSKNDQYFVDGKNNIVAIAPFNNPELFQQTIQQNVSKGGIKQLNWVAAFQQGVKGVPAQLPDGSSVQKEVETGNDSLANRKERVGEDTSSSGAGAYSMGLDMQGKNGKDVADQTYQNETTTSASSGQYSGKAIWSKNAKPAANKPAWKGGVVLEESVIKGDLDYLTDPSAFKKYIIKSEILQLLNESYEVNEEETYQQHAQRMLGRLQKYAIEDPMLNNDPDYQDMITIWTKRAESGKPEIGGLNNAPKPAPVKQAVKAEPSAQWRQPVAPMAENEIDEIFGFGKSSKEPAPVQNTPQFATNLSGYKNKIINFIRKDKFANQIIASLDKIYDQAIINGMNKGIAPEIIADKIISFHNGSGSSLAETDNFKETMIKDLKYTGRKVSDNESADELESKDGLFKGKWNNNTDKSIEPIAENANLSADNLAKWAVQYATSPESIQQFADENSVSLDSLKQKAKFYASNSQLFPNGGEIKDAMIKLLSLIQGISEGNGLWDNIHAKRERGEKPLHKGQEGYPDSKQWNKLTETKNNMNKNQYKELVKTKLKSSGKSLKNMNEDEKNNFFSEAINEYHEIKESMIDDQSDSMINNQDSSMVKSMDSDELNKDGASAAGSSQTTSPVEESEDSFSDQQNQQEDSAKFREMLKAKYGVDSVSDLSNSERMDLMKNMKFSDDKPEKPNLDMSQFKTSDDQKTQYQNNNNPTQMLDYLNNNLSALKTPNDFKPVALNFRKETGQNMQHPMAILGAIQKMPPAERSRFGNLENYFKSNMDRSMNEERKNPAILNVEKLGVENAKNFKTDTAKEDGVSDDTNYPFKKDGIYNEKVWPDPAKFYIEQDAKKYQTAKSMADIEKESLAKSKGSLENIGDSTADGENIPKRNLTKEEGYQLAMNRGNGMQDIVYDNKPSEKFEKRMEQDMGEHVYKARQDKMEYKANAPMYNKDTQPTENGSKKEEDNKYAKGYNSMAESVTAKYKDEFGKFKLVEFNMSDVEAVDTINENAIKLSMDGMGNKYSFIGKKINENVGYENVTDVYNFYIFENNVYAVDKKIETNKKENKVVVNESKFDKMKHLMNYKPSNYVDPKNSVKF
jgi:hypothetical protein